MARRDLRLAPSKLSVKWPVLLLLVERRMGCWVPGGETDEKGSRREMDHRVIGAVTIGENIKAQPMERDHAVSMIHLQYEVGAGYQDRSSGTEIGPVLRAGPIRT